MPPFRVEEGNRREASQLPEVPPPLTNLDAPFSYSWNASLRVAVIAGAQNLPFFPNFKSEEVSE